MTNEQIALIEMVEKGIITKKSLEGSSPMNLDRLFLIAKIVFFWVLTICTLFSTIGLFRFVNAVSRW